jgi:hypothetical protein
MVGDGSTLKGILYSVMKVQSFTKKCKPASATIPTFFRPSLIRRPPRHHSVANLFVLRVHRSGTFDEYS